MAIRTIVTLHCVDGKNKKTQFQYEPKRSPIPTDADVQALVDGFLAISELGIERVTVTYPVTSIDPVAATDIDARVSDTASLTCHKSESVGGTYSFQFAAVKDNLINPDGSLKITETVFSDWVELFDDGSGLFGVQGLYTISDGEELAENGSTPTLPSGYTQIRGKLTGRRRR